jgi:hypothetical protein
MAPPHWEAGPHCHRRGPGLPHRRAVGRVCRYQHERRAGLGRRLLFTGSAATDVASRPRTTSGRAASTPPVRVGRAKPVRLPLPSSQPQVHPQTEKEPVLLSPVTAPAASVSRRLPTLFPMLVASPYTGCTYPDIRLSEKLHPQLQQRCGAASPASPPKAAQQEADAGAATPSEHGQFSCFVPSVELLKAMLPFVCHSLLLHFIIFVHIVVLHPR